MSEKCYVQFTVKDSFLFDRGSGGGGGADVFEGKKRHGGVTKPVS